MSWWQSSPSGLCYASHCVSSFFCSVHSRRLNKRSDTHTRLQMIPIVGAVLASPFLLLMIFFCFEVTSPTLHALNVRANRLSKTWKLQRSIRRMLSTLQPRTNPSTARRTRGSEGAFRARHSDRRRGNRRALSTRTDCVTAKTIC